MDPAQAVGGCITVWAPKIHPEHNLNPEAALGVAADHLHPFMTT